MEQKKSTPTYTAEFRARGVRLYNENRSEYSSDNAAFKAISSKLGCSSWSLRNWVRPAERDAGQRPGLTSDEKARLKAFFNFLQQQERFGRFMAVYNNERPHQGLAGAYPGELYTPSVSVYEPPPEPDYPFHDRTVRVTRCGRICIGKRKINLSQVFAGQILGLREVDDKIWLVSFLDYDLGFFDNKDNRVEPAKNPFTPEKV